MRNIMKKVADQPPNTFFWLDIFLPAAMTKATIQSGVTIEAYLFFSFLKMRQLLNFD